MPGGVRSRPPVHNGFRQARHHVSCYRRALHCNPPSRHRTEEFKYPQNSSGPHRSRRLLSHTPLSSGKRFNFLVRRSTTSLARSPPSLECATLNMLQKRVSSFHLCLSRGKGSSLVATCRLFSCPSFLFLFEEEREGSKNAFSSLSATEEFPW